MLAKGRKYSVVLYTQLRTNLVSLYDDWYNYFQNLTDYGVITVSASGNGDRIYYGSGSAEYPSSFNNTIGVTGVYDNIHGSSSDHWTRAYKANSGYGVDIASIANATKLDWSPAIGCSEFNGTSNAAPIVTGILALIEQYQNNYKPSDELNFALVTTFFEETGDEPGCAPSTNTSEVSGYLDWINEYNNDTYYPDFPYQYADFSEYTYGWGIIDAYEIFEYFKENY